MEWLVIQQDFVLPESFNSQYISGLERNMLGVFRL